VTTRASIVALARAQLGYKDGAGYDGAQKYSPVVDGSPAQAWCADFYSWLFITAGLPLPSMQEGIRSGFAGVPEGMDYARVHGALNQSWQAQPCDGMCLDTGSGAQPGHIEFVVSWASGILTTIGGNSVGPEDQPGGVWLHTWSCPAGVGNPQIMGIIDAGGLVTFAAASPPPAPTVAPRKEHPMDFFQYNKALFVSEDGIITHIDTMQEWNDRHFVASKDGTPVTDWTPGVDVADWRAFGRPDPGDTDTIAALGA
jgi:hypothetical protein